MRRCGVLMPLSALPGAYGIGSMGGEARAFVDFLARAGQSSWQLLPIGPTGYGDSPYQSFSAFSGNPYFIDIDALVQDGLLGAQEAAKARRPVGGVDYAWLYETRLTLLQMAVERMPQDAPAMLAFFDEEAWWLEDYALFMAIKGLYGDVSWQEWPDALRLRDEAALREARARLTAQVRFWRGVQYVFYRQWGALKAYANKRGVELVGDIPIYVSPDSSDIWAAPALFQMDKNRRFTHVAGCPPDGFSVDGQLWGNPLYAWEYHKKTDFAWWGKRLCHAARVYDVTRIDHFRGFAGYFSIPAGGKPADGAWVTGPGKAFIESVNRQLPGLCIIAEDLGHLTPDVVELLRYSGYPGMKVLQFAFDSREESDYMPHNYEKNCVVYTGTHDNTTTADWAVSAPAEDVALARRYFGLVPEQDFTASLIRAALASVSELAIIPMADWLGLGVQARINKPSTVGGNWVWRMEQSAADAALAARMAGLARLYGRGAAKTRAPAGKENETMQKAWWKEAVVYQVYPRSFCDSNGDGVGDLPGIASKLDYFKELGVDVVWLSPVYESPNDDNGYDISNYRDIMAEFGTLADWEALLAGVHARGMRLIMDLVVNHTSDEHPWFVESRGSKDNKYRDYYIWRAAKPDGSLPNNWGSYFSGPAWEYDKATGEYYLHLFSKKQADLNWESPDVRREVKDIVRFWLDKGIDGFRIDVVNQMAKAKGLPDGATEDMLCDVIGTEHHANLPENHAILQELTRDVFSKYDVMTVGESSFVDPEEGARYSAPERGELNMVIQFEAMGLDYGGDEKFSIGRYRPKALKEVFACWQNGLNGRGWNCNYLTSHDQPRHLSRYGDDGTYHFESATMFATLLHTLQGTPFIYQGEELGMTNMPFTSFADFRDVEVKNWLAQQRKRPDFDEAAAMVRLRHFSRDNARTPMQWTHGKNAGFTAGTPWIGVNPNYTHLNAEDEAQDEGSVLSYYKRLTALRHAEELLVYGDFTELLPEDEAVFAYVRSYEGKRALILLNMTGQKAAFALPFAPRGTVKLANVKSPAPLGTKMALSPWEAQVVFLED